MKRTLFALFLAALVATDCAVKNPLTGGTGSTRTVAELWSDVPKMDELSPSQLEIPLSIKLLMRTALNQILGRGARDTGDWIVFDTARTTDDIRSFYSNARMASSGWDKTDKSTCLTGGDLGFPQTATVCLFKKTAGDKDVILMILPAHAEKAGRLNVFFVRIEVSRGDEPNKGPDTVSTKPDDESTASLTNVPAPYGIDQRPAPSGIQLSQLLPVQVGAYTRASIRLATNQNLGPEEIQAAIVEGASVYADYRAGNATIFVELGVAHSVADAREALEAAVGDTGGVFPTDPRFGARGREPSYLKVIDNNGAFFAWTRGAYYFSAHAKTGEPALDAFMKAFPY